MIEDYGKQIRAARLARGLSQMELASLVGTTQSTIERIENGGSIRSRYRHEVASELGLAVPKSTIQSGAYKSPPEFLGERDLPVYAAVEGGIGEMVVSNDPIEFVPRPWFLQRVKEAYAVVVTGESMLPVYDPGDMVLINPKLPPLKGKDAIFVAGEELGDFRAMLKRYLGYTSLHWHALQFNPPEGQRAEMKIDRKEWVKALRVVGRYSG